MGIGNAEDGFIACSRTDAGLVRRGLGVAQDYAEAVKWYRLAAEQGLVEAQSNLGRMYYYGLGVAQDFVTAHMWANIAAASGGANAMKMRVIVTEMLTPTDISKAQKLAREWMEKHPRQ